MLLREHISATMPLKKHVHKEVHHSALGAKHNKVDDMRVTNYKILPIVYTRHNYKDKDSTCLLDNALRIANALLYMITLKVVHSEIRLTADQIAQESPQ